jgi:phytoene desaturase
MQKVKVRQKNAVVVGGGLGGLATALRLAAAGWRVTVCEQGDTFGGKMNLWQQDGFRFDTGPSLITMRWVFAELFAATGRNLYDFLELVPMRPLAEYVYPDGTRFTYSTSLPDWLATLRQIEPRDVDGFLRFMQLGARLFEVSRHTFLRRSPGERPDWAAFRALRHMPLRYGWGKYHRAIAAHFKSPLLRQLYNRYPTYVGSSPYLAPATLAVIPYLEYAFGGWYIKGGLYCLVEALLQIARQLGVELLTQARVTRITHEGGRVNGVETSAGAKLAAEVVVMNGDAANAPALLGVEDKSPREEELSLSGVIQLAAVKNAQPQLFHHTVYFSGDYRREFSQLFEERIFPDDPTVYVSAPSRNDRSLAPGAGETLFIMANAPARLAEVWDEAAKRQAEERIWKRLAASGFSVKPEEVAFADTWTPRRIAQRYLMPGGAIYGTHSHGWRRAFLRPPNRDRKFGGLYYVGGSTHPGGGTPTVLLSAQITCGLIQRNENP